MSIVQFVGCNHTDHHAIDVPVELCEVRSLFHGHYKIVANDIEFLTDSLDGIEAKAAGICKAVSVDHPTIRLGEVYHLEGPEVHEGHWAWSVVNAAGNVVELILGEAVEVANG